MFKQYIKNAALFLVACVASPCCTPLIVPLGLALLAGTPVAAWAALHLGWVYGGLTLVSIASLVWLLRRLGGRKPEGTQDHLAGGRAAEADAR